MPNNVGLAQSFTTTYNTPQTNTPASTASPFATGDCGYQGDVGWSAPSNQVVSITDSLEGGGVIYALLNKPFSMSTSSEWQSFIPAPPAAIETAFQAVSQAFGNYSSLFSQYTSRRIWRGTSALRLSLDLYFYAVNDAYNEVLEPCMRLQRLSLPTYKLGSANSTVQLLTPPGPDPFTFNSQTPGGELISISIGSLITFSTVIVKEVVITFDQKYDINGYPMSANAFITFETFQLLTKEDLSGYISPSLPGAGNNTNASSNPNPNLPPGG